MNLLGQATTSLYQNDSSYLKLNGDTAEFAIYKKLYTDTMEYRLYKKTHQDTIRFFNRLQRYRHIQGKGAFYVKDSVIYIQTIGNNKESYPKFEDVGDSELNEKLSIEVFDQNNNMFSTFYVRVEGVKNGIRYEKDSINTCEVNLSDIKKPVLVRVYPLNDSFQKCFFPLEIPVNLIKTNKIKVYLTNTLLVKDKLVKFHLKKEEHGVSVTGPQGIYKEKEEKRKFIFFKETHIYPCSGISIPLYESPVPEVKP